MQAEGTLACSSPQKEASGPESLAFPGAGPAEIDQEGVGFPHSRLHLECCLVLLHSEPCCCEEEAEVGGGPLEEQTKASR